MPCFFKPNRTLPRLCVAFSFFIQALFVTIAYYHPAAAAGPPPLKLPSRQVASMCQLLTIDQQQEPFFRVVRQLVLDTSDCDTCRDVFKAFERACTPRKKPKATKRKKAKKKKAEEETEENTEKEAGEGDEGENKNELKKVPLEKVPIKVSVPAVELLAVVSELGREFEQTTRSKGTHQDEDFDRAAYVIKTLSQKFKSTPLLKIEQRYFGILLQYLETPFRRRLARLSRTKVTKESDELQRGAESLFE